MKLPKSWTKVTTFSKILATILFVSLPCVGFYFGVKYQRLITSSNQVITTTSSNTLPTPSILSPPPTNIDSSSIDETQVTSQKIHLYPAYGADQNTQINKIHIISLLFVPKDITTPVKSEWLSNMNTTDLKIKNFFEKQFNHKIKISYQVVSEPIIGEQDISNYSPSSLVQEAKAKTSNRAIHDSYNVWMIYLVRDQELTKNIIGGNLGGLVNQQSATQYEFWLDNNMINVTGIIGSAHEFAHVLGIPHPWELPSNTTHDPNYGNTPGDLMGYSNNGLGLDDLYIREDVKKEMGL